MLHGHAGGATITMLDGLAFPFGLEQGHTVNAFNSRNYIDCATRWPPAIAGRIEKSGALEPLFSPAGRNIATKVTKFDLKR